MAELRSTWVFGKAARVLGLLTEEQALEAARMQEELEEEGISLRFGEVLVEGQILSRKQVDQVLEARPEDPPDPDDALFGAIAVENGFLDPGQLEECVEVQQDLASELADPSQVPKLGELILTEEYMEPAEVEAVLKIQQRLKIGAFALTPSKMLLLKKKKKQTLKVRSPEEALFCKAAIRKQMLSPTELTEILQIQMEDPRPRSVGEIAFELGYMDQVDVATLQELVNRKDGVKERRRRHQTTAGIRLLSEDVEFSNAAIKNGFVTEAQQKKAERTFKALQFLNFPRSLGEILFDQGVLTGEQIKAVLDIMRLKGAVLPAYRLEEILLSEREDAILTDLIQEGGRVDQDQVTECIKLRKELRQFGIRRKVGEVMLVKGYLQREDLRHKPGPKRERGRRRDLKAERKDARKFNPVLAIGGGVAALAALILIVLLATQSSNRPSRGPSGKPSPESGAAPEPAPVPPAETGPPPGKDPVESGYVQWKGVWIPKEQFKSPERDRFYRALRQAVDRR